MNPNHEAYQPYEPRLETMSFIIKTLAFHNWLNSKNRLQELLHLDENEN